VFKINKLKKYFTFMVLGVYIYNLPEAQGPRDALCQFNLIMCCILHSCTKTHIRKGLQLKNFQRHSKNLRSSELSLFDRPYVYKIALLRVVSHRSHSINRSPEPPGIPVLKLKNSPRIRLYSISIFHQNKISGIVQCARS